MRAQQDQRILFHFLKSGGYAGTSRDYPLDFYILSRRRLGTTADTVAVILQ